MRTNRKPILAITLSNNASMQKYDEIRERLKICLNDEYNVLILNGEKESVELLSTRKISKKKYTTLLNLINKK